MHNNTSHRHLPPELQAFREVFPLLNSTLYLANCSQGPLAVPVRTAIETFLEGWAKLGMHWDAWIAEVEQARAAFAALIGAHSSEIAVGTSVSQLVSSVASALVASSQSERKRIVSSTVEFPGVAHAWLAMRPYGWHVELLASDDYGMVGAERFATAVDEKTALISVPHVCYANGALTALEPVITSAHAQGTFVFVDAYQSVGTLPIDVKASGMDFLAAGTLKYLLGTTGIAFLYISPAVLERLEPTVTGWFGRSDPFAFNPADLDYADRASRFDLGTPPILNAYAARAGMHVVAQAGVERVRDQIERLSVLAYDLAPRLGLRIMGPRLEEGKGATTAIDVGSQERAHVLERELRAQSIIASARGSALRLAPHGFTYEEEMEQALYTVAHVMQEH